MSQSVTVDLGAARSVFDILRVLMPKGEDNMPVGLYVSNGRLIITCTQGCIYQAELLVEDTDTTAEASILYRDISPLLATSGVLTLEFETTNVTIHGEGFSAECAMAFSVVGKSDFCGHSMKELTSQVYASGLKTILNVGIDKLYNRSVPISIFDNVATQQFPNVFVQVRANGLPVRAVLDATHVRLLNYFEPRAVVEMGVNSLLFANSTAYLQVPCKPVNSTLNAVSLLEDMKSVTRFDSKSYLDKLRSMAKLWSKDYCKVTLYKEGVKTTLRQSNVSVDVHVGLCDERVVSVFELPTQLWFAMLKGAGTESVEVLYGGDKVCLRTPFTIIVTRVLR